MIYVIILVNNLEGNNSYTPLLKANSHFRRGPIKKYYDEYDNSRGHKVSVVGAEVDTQHPGPVAGQRPR